MVLNLLQYVCNDSLVSVQKKNPSNYNTIKYRLQPAGKNFKVKDGEQNYQKSACQDYHGTSRS